MIDRNENRNLRKKYETEEERKEAHLKSVKKYRSTEKGKISMKKANDNSKNTFGRNGKVRGDSGIMIRDYELTSEQLKRRNKNRLYNKYKSIAKQYSVLVWYDGKLDDLKSELYDKIYDREYARQWRCAILGRKCRANPSEHFLFDFDLESMLKDNVYVVSGNCKKYIKKMVERK